MSENETLRRAFAVELSEAEGRILEGRVCPYDQPAQVQDPGIPPYWEVFAPGAFKRSLAAPNRVEFRFEHRDGLTDRIGKTLKLREEPDGLYGTFKVAEGTIGDHALALVDDGVLEGFSVGFVPLGRQRRNQHGHVVRARCHLGDVSLVPVPAYEGGELIHRSAPLVLPPEPIPEEQAERLRAIGISL